MNFDMLGLALHALLVLMSGIGITLLLRAEQNLERYCRLMEDHTKALSDFVSTIKPPM